MNTPESLSNEQIMGIACASPLQDSYWLSPKLESYPGEVREITTFARAIIDARDKQWEAMLAAPHEAKTHEEKTAYAFGWWKALESVRAQPVAPKGVHIQHTLAKPATRPEPESEGLNHLCKGRLVHLPRFEDCPQCGWEGGHQ